VTPIVSLPSLAVLKICAWNDRQPEQLKDADDFLLLLRTYIDAGNWERLNNREDILAAYDYDMTLAGAYILGQDATTISSDVTRTRLHAILANPRLRSSLHLHMSSAEARRRPDDVLTTVNALLSQFIAGLRS